MALASERLITAEEFNSLLSAMAGEPALAERIGEIDRLKEDWEERERYITKEALDYESKYNKLVEQYRKRFSEGLQGTAMGNGNSLTEEVVGGVREYTEEDLYLKEE